MTYGVMNFVNICWGNGMLPDGTKIDPDPMLTSVYPSNTLRQFMSLINGVAQYRLFQKAHKA